jgi:hypothetical protein
MKGTTKGVRVEFEERETGGWVQPVGGLTASELHGLLPPALQRHGKAGQFIDGCIDSAALWLHMAGDAKSTTTAELRDALRGVEQAAHAARNDLQPLRGASDVFEALAVNYHYLALRAREGSANAADRPKVPALPSDTPPRLQDLLKRIELDLQTLETTCAHVAGKIVDPTRNPPKHYERGLARALIAHHVAAFGNLPPVRQWFGDRFVKRVADRVGMSIGWRLVSEEIDATRQGIPPR